MLCDDDGSPTPRGGCGCRMCYRAREHALDERLIQMMREPIFKRRVRRSDGIIHETVRHYLAGSCDLPTLYIELIKRLAADSDAAFDRELSLAALKTHPMFVSDAP